jgi:hypothetical protein
MLRMFLGNYIEPLDSKDSLAIEQIKHTILRIEQRKSLFYADDSRRTRILRWCEGFLNTLRELEESLTCCQYFANQIHCAETQNMNMESSLEYKRFVYFYKNTLIRIFSLLDKLGYFMNDFFELHTEEVKSQFSFFTMLRRFEQSAKHKSLYQALQSIKDTFQPPLFRLREQRNLEIHYINIELVEQLMEQDVRYCNRFASEFVNPHLQDLQWGCDMVSHTIHTVYKYVNDIDQSEAGEFKS